MKMANTEAKMPHSVTILPFCHHSAILPPFCHSLPFCPPHFKTFRGVWICYAQKVVNFFFAMMANGRDGRWWKMTDGRWQIWQGTSLGHRRSFFFFPFFYSEQGRRKDGKDYGGVK